METPDTSQGPTLTLRHLLEGYEAGRQAARPSGLTASGVHPKCLRQTALIIQGHEATDPVERVTAATVGSLLHEAVADLWRAADSQALVEQRTDHGQADVVRPAALEVRDLKTVGGHVYEAWEQAGGPPDEVWAQLAIYAADHGADDGWLLVVDALDRERGRTATYWRPYQDQDGQATLALLEDTAHHLTDTDPWDVEPTGSYGPNWVCQRCPFRTPCGRAQEDTPHQYEDATLQEAAADYLMAKDMERDAKALKKRAQARLRGIEGQVGPYQVKWTTRTMPEHMRAAYDMTYVTVKKAQ